MRKPEVSSGTLVKAAPPASSMLAACAGTGLNKKRVASRMSERMGAVLSSEQAGQESRLMTHGRPVFGIRHEHFLFRGHATRQGVAIAQRGGNGSDPRAIDQRQRNHFKYHSRIIGMAYEAKRSGGHNAYLRGIHDVHAPQPTQRKDDPEAQ